LQQPTPTGDIIDINMHRGRYWLTGNLRTTSAWVHFALRMGF